MHHAWTELKSGDVWMIEVEVGLYHDITFIFVCTPLYYVGEFGIVYKAHLVKFGQSTHEIVAVKTLKG